MAKGNWSKYNPRPRCFFCGKVLVKKTIRHNPEGRVACENHATQHSVHLTGGTLPALKPLPTSEMKFYIENHEGTKVFKGTQSECEAEMNRLVLNEEGYWRMFNETDHDEPWQEGGLEELSGLLQVS